MQQLITVEDLCHSIVRLAAFTDGCKKSAVLQLVAIHARTHFSYVDFFVFDIKFDVISGMVCCHVAEVAKERNEQLVVAKTQAQYANCKLQIANCIVGSFELSAQIHRNA